jgi:hypothetical protein
MPPIFLLSPPRRSTLPQTRAEAGRTAANRPMVRFTGCGSQSHSLEPHPPPYCAIRNAVVQPEKADFGLPSGRYVLVLKESRIRLHRCGEVSDPAQCLERTEAANGTFYSDCEKNRVLMIGLGIFTLLAHFAAAVALRPVV